MGRFTSRPIGLFTGRTRDVLCFAGCRVWQLLPPHSAPPSTAFRAGKRRSHPARLTSREALRGERGVRPGLFPLGKRGKRRHDKPTRKEREIESKKATAILVVRGHQLIEDVVVAAVIAVDDDDEEEVDEEHENEKERPGRQGELARPARESATVV